MPPRAPAPSVALEPGVTMQTLVEGSRFHTLNGLAFGPDGRLYAASVMGESIFAVDLAGADVDVVVGPLAGESDDLLFTPSGDMIWTALLEGAVRLRSAAGEIRDLATGLPGANSIALTRDGTRLFVGQVFMAEGLWEIDLAGDSAPRLVTDDTGGVNAFAFGPDGMIYGPSWERGEVLVIDPEDGRTTVIAEGLSKPGAVKFDASDQLYVLDDATGELFALDRAGEDWTRRLIARLATATDNMAIAADGLVYVSNMADNSIHEVDPRTGAVRELLAGRLGFPRSIAVGPGADGDELHVADSCAYRVVDVRTGAVRDVARAVASELKFPSSVSVCGARTVLTGETFGVVQLFAADGELVREVDGFEQPGAAIECEDGSLIVSEPAAGRVWRVTGEHRSVLVEGLRSPAALADAHDGTVYVAESASGRLLSVDRRDGSVTECAAGLGAIRALAVAPDGSVLVLETTRGGLHTVDPTTGASSLIARDLPVGYLTEPYPRSGGLALGSDGAVYVAADVDNAIYRLQRRATPNQESQGDA